VRSYVPGTCEGVFHHVLLYGLPPVKSVEYTRIQGLAASLSAVSSRPNGSAKRAKDSRKRRNHLNPGTLLDRLIGFNSRFVNS
jgi:hypothetical protein